VSDGGGRSPAEAHGAGAVRRLAVLGSTGSIGVQALEVAARERGRLRVVALAAGAGLDALVEQARVWRPEALALERPADEAAARARLAEAAPDAHLELGSGAAERLVAGCDADVVLNGIVGAAGLRASLAALGRGLRLALANKETLVVGGPLVRAALERGGELLPVDSEHSAALQCLGGRPPEEVLRLVITASGGALRSHPDWRRATAAEVLAHPVWRMGRRITVDSATLFNKGLELIEARALFGLEWSQLDAVLHPEARVHALATFRDGSTVVQAAAPDMRLPIQLALSWPARWDGAVAPLDPADLAGLTFAPLPAGRHPAMDLALAAGRAGGTAPCAVNAADEVAVAAFLAGALPLGGVPEVLARVLERHAVEAVESVEQLERVDAWAREAARAVVAAR
jgi:1-deoxy-D-xylulose-5-phosphate reductoisomerase